MVVVVIVVAEILLVVTTLLIEALYIIHLCAMNGKISLASLAGKHVEVRSTMLSQGSKCSSHMIQLIETLLVYHLYRDRQ